MCPEYHVSLMASIKFQKPLRYILPVCTAEVFVSKWRQLLPILIVEVFVMKWLPFPFEKPLRYANTYYKSFCFWMASPSIQKTFTIQIANPFCRGFCFDMASPSIKKTNYDTYCQYISYGSCFCFEMASHSILKTSTIHIAKYSVLKRPLFVQSPFLAY